MKRLAYLLLPAALVGLAAEPARADPGEGPPRKYALLVGVKDYSRSDGLGNLKHTEDDVNDLAALLKDQLRYDRVVVLTQERGNQRREFDPTADNIQEQLQSLLEDCRKGDTVLVAFSGHGAQLKAAEGAKDEEQPFFCPMDAKLKSRKNLVALAEVYKRLADCPADLKLLLVDACRDEPGKGAADAFEPPPPPKGVAALYSCSKGQKSFESDKLGHGVFFHYVIEGLKGEAANKKGEVTLNALADYVSYEVRARVKDEFSPTVRQTPNQVGDVDGAAALARVEAIDPAVQAKAVEAVKRLGGTVRVDEKRPGKPVVAASFPGTATDADLKVLAGLKDLQTLDLTFSQVTDAGMKELTGLKGLKELHLYVTEVGDAGLKDVAALKGRRNCPSAARG
jgi:hypothetical protein